MRYEIGTIRQVHSRLLEEGICISERALRVWIRQGLIPAAYIGKKAYISYSNIMRVIEAGTPTKASTITIDGIRKIC